MNNHTVESGNPKPCMKEKRALERMDLEPCTTKLPDGDFASHTSGYKCCLKGIVWLRSTNHFVGENDAFMS